MKVQQRVPSVEKWDLASFVKARRAQFEAHANGQGDCLCKDPFFEGATEIVVPLPEDDEVICDDCNATVEGPTVTLVRFGMRAVCDTCAVKHEKEPLTWRVLNDDGSLGGPA